MRDEIRKDGEFDRPNKTGRILPVGGFGYRILLSFVFINVIFCFLDGKGETC
tara:strand:+ start:609 stop:764 length:156 start_codon:yes stop_codon:yes gene_type:complete